MAVSLAGPQGGPAIATKLKPVHPNQIVTVLCHLGTHIGIVGRRRRSGLASCVNTIKPGAVPLAALLHRGKRDATADRIASRATNRALISSREERRPRKAAQSAAVN